MQSVVKFFLGRPPSARAWAHQCGLYVGIMVVEKIIITGLLGLQFWARVRDLILAPITDPQARVVVVVLVIPFFVNVSRVYFECSMALKEIFCSLDN